MGDEDSGVHELSHMASNISPLLIILSFFVVFTITSPWMWSPFYVGMSTFLLVVPFVTLAGITYLLRRKLVEGERRSSE